MPDQPGFLATVRAAPKDRSRASRLTSAQGVFYAAVGVALTLAPSNLLALVNGMPADEQGMVRMSGVLIVIIGWFYFMGGRTGAPSFALATVVDRLAIPFALGGLVLFADVSLQLVAPIIVLDPILAAMVWWAWRTERA